MENTESTKCANCGRSLPTAECEDTACGHPRCAECGQRGRCADPECVNVAQELEDIKVANMRAAAAKNPDFRFGF